MNFSTLFKFGTRTSSETGFDRALALFKDAARRVPAYKDFLMKAGVRPDSIETETDFKLLPRTDKQNYMTRYSIAERSWDGTLESARYISTSSGSTGVPFFWPRGVTQDAAVGYMFRNIFADTVRTNHEPLLFVNSFALGTWIAGFEFYNASKWVGDQDGNVTIVTPGIDRDEALRQIKKLKPLFKRIVLAGYPPFVKDIIEDGEKNGLIWSAIDLYLLVAGEAVSSTWKNRMLDRIGRSGEYHHFINVYGMAESGVVAHDTPLAQLVRESADLLPEGTLETRDGLPVTGMYQYYPHLRYFEAEAGEALSLTADAGLPLIRYDTRDTGGILARSCTELLGESFARQAHEREIDLSAWQLPFVYLNGRKDLSVSFYALMIYVENIKYALENSANAALLSGLFTMSVEHTENLDQQFIIKVELAGSTIPGGLRETLTDELVNKLCSVNSEYAKLLSSLGARARPEVVLLARGQIESVPGRKHRWIKRS